MAIQDILEEIKKQAEKENAELGAELAQAIEKMTHEYAQKREQKKREMDDKVSENATKITQRAETFAKMETRNHLLRAKRDMLTRVMNETIDALVRSDRYTDMIAALLKKAKKSFTSGIVIPARGKEAETKAALEKSGVPFTLASESAPIRGGFILDAGKVEVNVAFDAILAKELWDKLELELNKLLFP